MRGGGRASGGAEGRAVDETSCAEESKGGRVTTNDAPAI